LAIFTAISAGGIEALKFVLKAVPIIFYLYSNLNAFCFKILILRHVKKIKKLSGFQNSPYFCMVF